VSKGIVAFAVNTNETDYVGIAHTTLSHASRVLGIPYTVITSIDQDNWVNHRYDIDTEKFVEWRNVGRYHAYELSPYDETLVIDVDYVVQDAQLLEVFDTEFDYLLQRHSHSLNGPMYEMMGSLSLPFVWATVFAFRKTPRAKMYFELVKRVQDNYSYYRELFKVQERNYRNDYAFAMADYILNGYTVGTNSIPGSMLTIDQPINQIEVRENTMVIRDTDRAYVVPKTNMHIMSKAYLQSPEFKEFIQNVTA
jgi:hypothetical protein